MENNIPTLFVEINDTNYIFNDGILDENQNFQIKKTIVTPNKDIKKNKFLNLMNINLIIKNNIEIIENELNHVFKEVIIILDSFNYSCINISGSKKLNGSQILKDNISYILNNLKLVITENEKDKTILHIFNSKSVLDGTSTQNLPIGLFGDFYNHELSFFLINNNDLKNLKNIFNKNNLKVKKIILKDFIEGAELIKQNHGIETFFKIKINKDTININFFDNSSFRFSQNFNFGSNIILNDISKICSINHEMINKILSDEILENINSDSDLLEDKYFVGSNYRKIRKKLIIEIVEARIEEIVQIIFEKNVNIENLIKNNKVKIYLNIKDAIIVKNFKENFIKFFSKNQNFETSLFDNDNLAKNSSLINTIVNLTIYGWKKEAIPVTQTKSSLITRIFKSLFD